jgi:hypothetical protein
MHAMEMGTSLLTHLEDPVNAACRKAWMPAMLTGSRLFLRRKLTPHPS